MPPTSDEIARTEAPQTDFEVRIFVGPKRGMIERENLALGEPWAPFVETLLTSNVTHSSTSIPVANASSFTSGAILVHPHGEREAYEFIKYTSKTQKAFNGLTRVYTNPGDADITWGKHDSGATVSEFFEITHLATRCEVSWNEQDGAATWRVKLDGRNYDSFLLDNDNAVVAHLRQRPKNGNLDQWTDWDLWWLGYIKKCDIKDSGDRNREWNAEIEGVSQYVAAFESPPRHYGKNDLAEGKSVLVSSYLEDPFMEWGTGEYLGYPDLNGDKVNDGDLSTLWISEGEPVANPESFVASAVTINELMLRPPPGYNERDHQWVELSFKRADGGMERLKWWCLCNKQTTYKRVSWTPTDPETGKPQPGITLVDWLADMNFVRMEGAGGLNTSDGEFVILCFNRPKFLERYPNAAENRVIDMRGITIGSFALDVSGDFLLLKNFQVRTAANVWWTDHTDSWWDANAPYETADRDDGSPHWSGPMISVPPAGHSFRRYPTGNSPDLTANMKDGLSYWKEDERHPTPGYYTSGEAEWISVDLGEMGITLEEQLEAGDTSEIKLNKIPLGLLAQGMVKINQEIIKYGSTSDTSLVGLIRGVGGTSPETHPAESVVYALDDLDEDATLNHLISSVQWRRREIRSGGKAVVPERFTVYMSDFVDPLLPDSEDWDEGPGEGGWEDYWDEMHTVTGWSNTTWIGPVNRRARHVLIIIHKMTDNGRVKMNTLHVWSGQTDVIEIPPEADEELKEQADIANSGAVIFDMLHRDIGLDPSLFTLVDDGRAFVDLHTSRSSLLQLIKDISRRTGTTTVFQMDETVLHRYHPLYPLNGLEDLEIEWDRDNARNIALTRPFRHNIKQAVIRAHETDKEERFEAKYPIEALDFGSTYEMEDWVLTDPNDAALMAEFMFRQRNAPLTAMVVPVGPAEWVRPGQRHTINWDMDAQGEYLKRRNFVVLGVQWKLNFGEGNPGAKEWHTTIRLKELIF